MNEGFVIGGGEEYYCTKRCLYQHYTFKEFDEMYDDGKGDSYFTTWEDETEYQYWQDGTEIDEEFGCLV